MSLAAAAAAVLSLSAVSFIAATAASLSQYLLQHVGCLGLGLHHPGLLDQGDGGGGGGHHCRVQHGALRGAVVTRRGWQAEGQIL